MGNVSAVSAPQAERAPSLAERLCRRDVAACYRLVERYGFSDLTDGFVAARHPEAPGDVILGGYALFPEQATPAALHRRTIPTGHPPLEKHGGVDVDALTFSRAVFDARPDFNALIHAHPRYARAFSALDIDLLPISQWGHMFHGRVGTIPFDEDVSSGSSCGMMAWHLKQGKEAILLRNHGVMIPGTSVPDAFFRLHRLEQAFQTQLEAMATGAPLYRPDSVASEYFGMQYWSGTDTVDNDGTREWPGFLTMLGMDEV